MIERIPRGNTAVGGKIQKGKKRSEVEYTFEAKCVVPGT